MPRDLRCPACGEPLHRPSRSAYVRCPRCQGGFVAPAAEPSDAPPRRHRSRAWRTFSRALLSLWKRPKSH